MKKLLPVVAVILAAITVYMIIVVSTDNVDGLAGDPWVLVALEEDGRKIPPAQVPFKKIQFTKKAAIWTVATKEGLAEVEGVFKLDPNSKPKRIDIEVPGMREAAPAIYEVKDNLLLICIGQDRPRD